MDAVAFKKDFLTDVKIEASQTGEGSCATFVARMADKLIEAEVLSEFNPCFYTGLGGKTGRSKYRVDGYFYNEFDNTMDLVIAEYADGDSVERLTKTDSEGLFSQLKVFLYTAFHTNLYKEIEISTPCSDLVSFLRDNEKNIRRYRMLIFTDKDKSELLKNVEIQDFEEVPVEGHIWDINRLHSVCDSERGREAIEIDFKKYCKEGIPCLLANVATTSEYKSYLAVIPGSVIADIYDEYGSRLLEGNVRSFLSTKVAVNKKIRNTILNMPKMFFAFNNGISATARSVVIDNGFIIAAQDFQIINGGQTTASLSNARYKDKANLDQIYVQMKLTSVDEISQEDADDLIVNISRSSNSQNKVSDVDFFAAHPFHRRMEQLSRILPAPAVGGAQYDTRWFYERARGQYLQEQMRFTAREKRDFQLKNPKSQVVKKIDLAKVQNTWRELPHVVSKGAQSNFVNFAEYVDSKWSSEDAYFNEIYYEYTVALLLVFQYLERQIPKQSWYEGGYRANIICYTVSLFRYLIRKQFPNRDLNLMLIWDSQKVPEGLGRIFVELAEKVLDKITDSNRKTANVTQWCKRIDCWNDVKTIDFELPQLLGEFLVTAEDEEELKKKAKRRQAELLKINAQMEVGKYSGEEWKVLSQFIGNLKLSNPEDMKILNIASPKDQAALEIACQMPRYFPTESQSIRLIELLHRAEEEGFIMRRKKVESS